MFATGFSGHHKFLRIENFYMFGRRVYMNFIAFLDLTEIPHTLFVG